MSRTVVSIVKYEKPLESVRKVIELIDGLKNVPINGKIFIKPNLVYWNRHCDFPKWGMLTTSRVVEDVVKLLSEIGVKDITIGDGIITDDPNDRETPKDAFEKLGYNLLKERYGVKIYDTFDRPFEKIELREGVSVKMNSDMLHSDFLIDIPVLKTHAQCVVSLGIKNLKGLINIPSRKKFHGADPKFNLHYNVAQLANKIPPSLTVIDGIYTIERGPTFDGKAHRSNILLASTDILAADLVGARLLGIDPQDVPHLVQAAKDRDRLIDLSDIEIKGESIEKLAKPHEWEFIYENNDTLPLSYARAGIGGISYPKYDETMCTFCSFYNGVILVAIKEAWKGEDFDNIEILTGKIVEPTPGMNKTILLGQCQYNKNKDHPDIKECIPIKGCPPDVEDIKEALKNAGIRVPSYIFKNIEKAPLIYLNKYKGKPEFEDTFYQIN
ncbi:MAG: DUF362 domain-containing protein [Promethearchaeota archaeon]